MAKKKKLYTLSELVAQCDPDAPVPKELWDWERAESIGREHVTGENQRLIAIAKERLEEPSIRIDLDDL
ncbi:hypothetical protein C9993_01455 [Marinobacter sp. Z-F4-2]|nr:hypothetical protein C9993_01455 [Marinobacter sp. Z-F4-2]